MGCAVDIFPCPAHTGPVITFANGSLWRTAYVERPLVTLAADGTPLSFHVGMGRSSYEDSCNWAQLFCVPGAEGCGPTIPPPPPPPHLVRLANGGLCVQFNSSAFPCSGTGAAAGCPLVMGPCDSGEPGAVWEIPAAPGVAGTFQSNVSAPGGGAIAFDVDCNSEAPHTLVKALASGAAPLTLDPAAGTIAFAGGMCLNTGQGPAVPPCGPKTEKWLPNQIQLAPCADPTAGGWSALAVA